MKDTTPIRKTFSWPCLCAYLLLALFIVIGLYTGLNWQLQSLLDRILDQSLQQPLTLRGTIWLFSVAFLVLFLGSVILHHIFITSTINRPTPTSEHDIVKNTIEQAPSPTKDNGANKELLVTMSHEIRTPMNGIIGMTNKLLESSLNDDQKQYILKIQETVQSLTKIMDEIVDAPELEAQQWVVEHTSFSLIETIDSCLDLLAKQVQTKQLAFYCCFMSGIPQQVHGDAMCLKQIILNLLTTAIHVTDTGTVAISVSGDLESHERVNLRIDIHCNAVDIDSEVNANLLERCPQIDTASDFVGMDSGVDLANSKQLIDLMQGYIEVQTIPDTGTIWRLNVSLGYCSGRDATMPLAPLHNKPILYVDHSELNSSLMFNQFTSWGMAPKTIDTAGSVIAVLNTATQQNAPFEIVVIHHDPPKLDGYALCRDIRQSESARTAKILLMMSRGKESTLFTSTNLPCDLSLTFPLRFTVLSHALLQLVGHSIVPTKTCAQMQPPPDKQAPSSELLNILLVEDNHVNQQVALSMLKKWGHRIDVAWNGLEALAAVKQQDYDLILMDIQMPEMDGITATQQIRQLEGKCASIPIVAVTANAMQGDRERFLAAGMDDYIAKPINRDAFYMVVHRYALQQRTTQSKAPQAAKSESTTPLLGDEVLSYLQSELSGETVSELIDEYMTHSATLLSQALVASEEQDAKNVEYAVHTLKGMSGALGALRMVDICQHILEACRSGEGTQQIGSHMNGLTGATEETQQALRAWLSEHESG
jgi:CheY-like chemotaxis protein